jgi:hypothetical protein
MASHSTTYFGIAAWVAAYAVAYCVHPQDQGPAAEKQEPLGPRLRAILGRVVLVERDTKGALVLIRISNVGGREAYLVGWTEATEKDRGPGFVAPIVVRWSKRFVVISLSRHVLARSVTIPPKGAVELGLFVEGSFPDGDYEIEVDMKPWDFGVSNSGVMPDGFWVEWTPVKIVGQRAEVRLPTPNENVQPRQE